MPLVSSPWENGFPVRNGTIKVFRLLTYTPARSLGVNYQMRWRLEDDGAEVLRIEMNRIAGM